MNLLTVLGACLLALVNLSSAEHWAVLVAGSNGYYNYRHQADVCHSYQILHKHGIPDERIIVLMYDDVANNRRNPTPGKVINQPGGPDVYQGVPKDYTGKDVTPENFLKILNGSDMTGIGSGKTLRSGKDDHVFVYFADHGAPGLIAFPRGELYARDLLNTINAMFAKEMFRQMVFYVEACESGSMFNKNKLPPNINVFATTAANGQESSYACYWDAKRQTYLADVYSAMWLQDSDKADMTSETLQQQFLKVQNETKTSHVLEFGDLSIAKEPISQFQGKQASNNLTKIIPTIIPKDAVPSPEVPMMTLYNMLQAAATNDERRSIRYEMEVLYKKRESIKQAMRTIVHGIFEDGHPKHAAMFENTAQVEQHECYKTAVTEFTKKCFNFNDYEYALRQIYVLSNLCDEGLNEQIILDSIHNACAK